MFRSRSSNVGSGEGSSCDSPQVGKFDRAVPLRESKGPLGPFRATKIWNSLIEHVKLNVEIKRRRYKMRHIEACFTGTDVVDVVLHFLLNEKDTFSPDLSREKAAKVCQMLMHRKIIHSATEREGSDKAGIFEDSSSKFYQFAGQEGSLTSGLSGAVAGEEEESGKENSSSASISQGSDKLRLLKQLEPAEEPASFEDEVQTRPLSELNQNVCGGGLIQARTSSASERVGPPSSTFTPSKTLSRADVDEVWRETALTQLLTHVELTFLDNILSDDMAACSSSGNNKLTKRQQQRQHLIISNLIARSWHLPLTPGKSLTSDPLLITAMECIEFLPNGENILSDPVFKRRGQEAKLWAKEIIVKHFQELGDTILPQRFLELHMAILNQLLSGAADNALLCLQLYMLLLPLSTREELYRLLKFMRSLSADKTVILDSQETNEVIVLRLLSRCIFHHKLLSDSIAQKLVQFLMHNVDGVFTVPRSVRQKVAVRLYQLKTGKSIPSYESSFCNRVSKEEFERQSKNCTTNSLIDLMNSVLDDTTMSLKEKKSRLKQFQKSYPELYEQHFDGML